MEGGWGGYCHSWGILLHIRMPGFDTSWVPFLVDSGPKNVFETGNSHIPFYLISWYLHYVIIKTTNSKIFSGYKAPKETAFRDQKMAKLWRNKTFSSSCLRPFSEWRSSFIFKINARSGCPVSRARGSCIMLTSIPRRIGIKKCWFLS